MNAVANPSSSRLGRPTKEQSEQRHDALLEIALDHFCEKGFEQATMEAITLSANMSKRTVYKLYPDKVSLFYAAVRRAMERAIVSKEELDALEMEHLESTLLAVAFLRLRFLLTQEGIKLQRTLEGEAVRFPEIIAEAYERGQLPITRFVADQIKRHACPGSVAHEQPERAANGFMSLVLSAPTRLLMWDSDVDEREIEQQIIFGVRLFLEGVKTG